MPRFAIPPPFHLDFAVRSSRIALLPPVRYDAAQHRLDLVLCLPRAPNVCDVCLVDQNDRQASGRAPDVPALRAMLRLEEDLGLLYHMTDRDPELGWVRKSGAGRVLRSATVYEDLVKALLLGGGGQGLAQKVLRRLCAEVGPKAPSGHHGFPDAGAMAARPLSFYEEIGCGKQARPLYLLARRCDSGALYPEALRRGPLSTQVGPISEMSAERFERLMAQEKEWEQRVRALLLSLGGFGERATELMLPLLGCYDTVRPDRSTLAAWRRRRSTSGRDLVAEIEDRIAPFAHYRGLVLSLLLSHSETSGALAA